MNMNISKLSLFAAVLCAVGSLASAAERTITWTTGQNPESALNGDVKFTYDTAGLVQNVTLNPKGDTIVFTGDKMNCHTADSTQSAWRFMSKGKIVFRNNFQARTLDAALEDGFSKTTNVTWRGYSTLLPTNGYQVVIENANLADWEPVEIYQSKTAEPGKPDVAWWLNRDMTMKILKVVREGDRMFAQYRCAQPYTYNDRPGWKRYYALKVEYKQIGADICARLAGAWAIWFEPDTGSEIETGSFDLDTLDIGDDKAVMPARVTGPTEVNGLGMNAVAFKFVGAEVVMRYEGTTDFTGSPRPRTGVRMEIADASKMTQTAYANPMDSGVLPCKTGVRTGRRPTCAPTRRQPRPVFGSNRRNRRLRLP